MEEIELRDLFFMIMKRMKMIVLIVILSMVTSFVVSEYMIKPEYETFTTLMLGKPADYDENNANYSYQDVLTNQKLIGTYAEIAKSKVVLNEVIDGLNLDMSASQLKDIMNISLLNNTEVIKVTVTNTNPQMAARIANETARVFMASVSDIMKIDNVQIIDKAEVPVKPSSPRVKLNVLIAGVLGLMMSLGIVFIVEMMDSSIKTPEDVEKYLNLPVIGMIPKIEE